MNGFCRNVQDSNITSSYHTEDMLSNKTWLVHIWKTDYYM